MAYKIHDAQFGFASSPGNHAKVVPLRTSLRVYVVLHVELVSGYWGCRIPEGHQQVAALKSTAEGQPILLWLLAS